MKKLLFLLPFFLNGCVYLTFDNSKAAPLVMVSRTPTPSFEEVRTFVQRGDLTYVAAGSGGILVYRTVGDQMQAMPDLSLSNIYANNLDPVFVRTVEVVENQSGAHLIFAFDTVTGGGIGVAGISVTETRLLGSLRAVEGTRIRGTVSRSDPGGGFVITAANENTGLLTYHLTITSNNVFDQQNLASIAGYIALQGLGGGFQPFELPLAPGIESQTPITNFEGLIELFQQNPSRAIDIGTNLPFLTPEQKALLSSAIGSVGEESSLLTATAEALSSAQSDEFITSARSFLGLTNPAPSNSLDLPPVGSTNSEYFLSNLLALTNFTVDPEAVNTPDFNPFLAPRPIPNADREIDLTASAFGLQHSADDQGILKAQLQNLTSGEQNAIFETLFQQADLLTRLIPLLERSGLDPLQLYQLWQDGRIEEIFADLDTALLADLIKLLPQTSLEVSLAVQSTNANLPTVRAMSSDGQSFYLALGKQGFAVVDRASGNIVDIVSRPFSEVESIAPFSAYGKNYMAVTDRLDGLSVYERGRNNKPGKRIAKLNLVGEGASLYAADSLIWVADGSNGVLAVRFNRDRTLSIDGEFFNKQGVARHVSIAQPREALVSYGADGFVRLRYTNIGEITQERGLNENPSDRTLARRTLEWNENSPLFRFLRRLF